MNKDKRQYRKDIKRHQKELAKIAKSSYPWDYFYSFDFIIEHLKMMKDYYNVGYNVWSCDEEVNERKEIIDNLLYEYDSYFDLPRSERENIAKELNVEVDKIEDNFNRIETEEIIRFNGKETKCTGMKFEDKYYPHEVWTNYIRRVSEAEEKHFDNFMELMKSGFRKLCD